MWPDRRFFHAFLVSLITHGAVIAAFSFPILLPVLQKEKGVRVSYVKTPPQAFIAEKLKDPSLKRDARETPRTIGRKPLPLPGLDKDTFFQKSTDKMRDRAAVLKPEVSEPEMPSFKKKVTLPPLDLGKFNDPTYSRYYQVVREKIRHAAYQNYTRTETGQVYLTFVLAKDGSLQAVKLVEERSTPDVYLREVALRSIREAAAFPVFPAALDYPELTFNIVISFEVE
jgi:hypothetical protein